MAHKKLSFAIRELPTNKHYKTDTPICVRTAGGKQANLWPPTAAVPYRTLDGERCMQALLPHTAQGFPSQSSIWPPSPLFLGNQPQQAWVHLIHLFFANIVSFLVWLKGCAIFVLLSAIFCYFLLFWGRRPHRFPFFFILFWSALTNTLMDSQHPTLLG